MVIEAIYHSIKNNYSYAIDDETVQIRIRTKKKDAKAIFIHAFDKYNRNIYHQIIEMQYEISDKYFDYYIANVKPKFKRLSYFFEIRGKYKEVIYMTEDAFYENAEDFVNHACSGYFEFSFINKADIFNPPKWIEKAVFYQIFPDRFNDGDKTNDPLSVDKWGAKPTYYNYAGGDIIGIIDKVPYLEELGINAIYLNPIFEASSNHRYDTEDYMAIDSRLGDKTIVKQLIEVCHKHHIKVVIDIAINHCSSNFLPFVDAIENGEKSKYKDWFNIHSFPVSNNDIPNYDTFGFNSYMPKLNLDNNEVRQYFIDVVKYWTGQFQIDGIRLDVANEISHSFWRELRREIKKINNDVFLLGEIWHNAMPWLIGDQFDSSMNYKLRDAVTNFFAYRNISVSEFQNIIAANLTLYPTNVSKNLFNIIDSHDTKRFLTECGENKDKFKQAVLFQMTFPGIPCIYYGDEIGLIGEADPDCRKCMYWDKKSHDNDLLTFYQRLIRLRKDNKAITHGTFHFVDLNNSNLLAYTRVYKNKTILVIFNRSENKIKINTKVLNQYHIVGNNFIDGYGYKIVINNIKN
jgi:glycosidase